MTPLTALPAVAALHPMRFQVALMQHDLVHVLESSTHVTANTFAYGLGWHHTLLHQASVRTHEAVRPAPPGRPAMHA